MKKRLIINADDFGWDRDVDEAILTLGETNCITSTSILSTHVTDESLIKLKQTPISKGLHLNLIEGRPLSSGLKSLVDKKGNFLSAQKLLAKMCMGRIDLIELEVEIKAQINKLLESGIKISHVDSHRHVHLFPVLGNVILPILYRNGIVKIRSINQNRVDDKRRLIIKLFSSFPNSAKKKFNKPELLLCDFSMNNNIDDTLFTSSIHKAFINHSTVEFMTHPAKEDRKGSYLKRKMEFNYLKSGSWKKVLEEQGVQLISYDEL